jgi:hypothetical protein
MAAATINISGILTGTPTGSRTIGPIALTSSSANGQVQRIVLQSGDNTITCPTVPAPSGCIIVLPSTNTSVTTLKGIGADTGIAIGKTTTQVINWDSTAVPGSFVLTSVATQTGLVTEIIFF